jgi:hypothetical protein
MKQLHTFILCVFLFLLIIYVAHVNVSYTEAFTQQQQDIVYQNEAALNNLEKNICSNDKLAKLRSRFNKVADEYTEQKGRNN